MTCVWQNRTLFIKIPIFIVDNPSTIITFQQLSILLCPSVAAVLICTDIVKSHFLFSSSSLRLEENSFSVIAFWTWMILRPGQCRIRYNISDDVCQFTVEKKSSISLFNCFVLVGKSVNRCSENPRKTKGTYSISCIILLT